MYNPVYFQDENGVLYYLKDGKYIPLQFSNTIVGGGGRGARGIQGIPGTPGGFVPAVTDATLTGDGSALNPLGLAGSLPVFQNGTFTLNADGSVGSGEVGGVPAVYNPLTKVMTFTTTKELKLWYGLTFNTNSVQQFSNGISDGSLQNCVWQHLGIDGGVDTLNCIRVFNSIGGNGWFGLITDIRDTEFDITFTQIGTGEDITGQMHLIEG